MANLHDVYMNFDDVLHDVGTTLDGVPYHCNFLRFLVVYYCTTFPSHILDDSDTICTRILSFEQ